MLNYDATPWDDEPIQDDMDEVTAMELFWGKDSES